MFHSFQMEIFFSSHIPSDTTSRWRLSLFVGAVKAPTDAAAVRMLNRVSFEVPLVADLEGLGHYGLCLARVDPNAADVD